MKIKELQEMLATYPEDLEVVVYGYESGCNSVNEMRKIKVYLNDGVEMNWWDGEHQFVEDYKDKETMITDVLLLGLRMNPNIEFDDKIT